MSTAFEELGGGRPPVQNLTPRPAHAHRFHESSGWCGCGLRDTGELAEGSVASRAARAVANV